MGVKSIKSTQYILNEFLDVTNINTSDTGIKDIIDKLCSLCFSDIFAEYVYYEFWFEFKDFISIFEMKEKYFLLRIFFPLMEELKNKNFEKHVLENLINRNNEKTNKISEEHKDSIEKFEKSEKVKKLLDEINNYTKDNSSYITNIYKFCYFIFFCIFIDLRRELDKILKQNISDSQFYHSAYSDIINQLNNKEINEIIDIIKKMDSLNHIKNAYKNILFLMNLKINEEKISSKEKIDEKFFQKYGDININNKLKWNFYEQNLSENNIDEKFNSIILEGKMTEKEKYNYDIFEYIYKIQAKEEDIKGIIGSVFKSLFYDKNILLIKIDTDYLKKSIVTVDYFEKDIESIKKLSTEKYSNIDIYAQYENQIINLDVSYDLFIKELKNKKIIFEQDEINKIIEQLKSQLDEEKEKNKNIEKELIKEKNQKMENDKILKDLKMKFDNKMLLKEKDYKSYLEKETKDSLIKIIIEKEKNIKELNSKLLRYPFSLEDTESLMTIIFESKDKKLISSVICKNTDEFYKIEAQLYQNHPEFFKKDISFYFNGKKINRFMSLEKSGIGNQSIIIMK